MEEFLNKILNGDCLELMKKIPDNSIDSCVTDPPYGLSKEPDIREVLTHWLNDTAYEHKSNGFMGKSWDSFVPGPEYWKELFRILKPGAHALIFCGTRTYDLLVIALRMSGFEIKDQIDWVFGSGFPKSRNISKDINERLGAERKVVGGNESGTVSDRSDNRATITAPSTEEAKEWNGYGSALKPAHEPICLVRKPISESSIAANVLRWGVGGINIDKCRIGKASNGRFPSNFILSHHPECVLKGLKKVKGHQGYPNGPGGIYSKEYQQTSEAAKNWNNFSTKLDNVPKEGFADKDGMETVECWDCHPECPVKLLNEQSGELKSGDNCVRRKEGTFIEHGGLGKAGDVQRTYGDNGGASRFFYCAKASQSEKHKGCEELESKTVGHNRFDKCGFCGGYILQNPTRPSACHCENPIRVHNIIKGNSHTTVKPIKLCRYLVDLVTPKDGVLIDPFCGSGSVLVGALLSGFNYIGMDLSEEYCDISRRRISANNEDEIDDSCNIIILEDEEFKQKTMFDFEE